MNPKQLAELYYQKVKGKSDWQTLIAADIRFESLLPTTVGKDAYITAASRFFKMAETIEVKYLIAEGDSVCAWVSYFLKLNGRTFTCLVSELMTVKDDRIISLSILFDNSSLKAFTSPN